MSDATDTLSENHLLLVDDDVVFSSILGKSMSKRGFSVTTQSDLSSARRHLESHAPEYVILDLNIGKDSGLTLIEELIAVNPDIRIIILTGYASVATAVEAIKLGAIHYLTKPVSADEIVKVLHQEEADKHTPIPEQPLSAKRLEWEHIQKVLLDHEGNISAAARAMGMHRRTLQRKLQKKPVKR